jgi:outer membrane receptor for ferrienterochelin and colicins
MQKIILLLGMAICFITNLSAQHHIQLRINGENGNTPIPGATIQVTRTGKVFSSDSSGLVHITADTNYLAVTVTAAEHETKQLTLTPAQFDTTSIVEIILPGAEDEMDVIIVQSTRTSRSIQRVPTRIETIEFEEIDEKNNMRPANVAMLLHESTGIQVQQTSATSANASIRIQGLDGRYTQLLKDGFANFGNFSSGLSVLEIPPLDLKQVEIIKGPASPLFGGGAIAGVVNFISKTPKVSPEKSFLINYSNIGQFNVGAFLSQKKNKIGYTLLALYNKQKAYDVDEDDFTEVPKSEEFTLHPKLFFYPTENTTIQIGNSFTTGKREGGDLQVINAKPDTAHTFFESNKTVRNISTFQLDTKTANGNNFTVKQSFSIFDRRIDIPADAFAGIDRNLFTDITYLANGKRHSLVLGANFVYNDFKEKGQLQGFRNFKTITGGLYGQHTWDATEKIKIESGLRVDVADYRNQLFSNAELFVLPRVSMLVNFSPQLSSRIGGGIGYKAPTLFTEATETIQYRDVLPLNNVRAEKSYGGTADINYRTRLGNTLNFSVNQLFFYTLIEKPLVLQNDGSGNLFFANNTKAVYSTGFETNARFIYKEYFKLFLGYTFTHAEAGYLPGNRFLPLVPKHKLNTALIYEKEGVIKMGLEGYFTGKQYLSNGTHTPAFYELGFMTEKIFKHFSVYINFENFTDTRQSSYKPVVGGTHAVPVFDEIWTHTEGFVFNGGIKIRL